MPPAPLTPPPGMAPANSGAPYAAAVPPGGSAPAYGGNAYATPYPGAPYAPSPYRSSPSSQPSGGELLHLGSRRVRDRSGAGFPLRCSHLRTCPSTQPQLVIFRIRPPWRPVLPMCRIGRSCWTTEADHARGSRTAGSQPATEGGRGGCAADQDRRRIADRLQVSSRGRRRRRWRVRGRPRIHQRIHRVHDQRNVGPLPGRRNGPGGRRRDRLHR